jgi:hypothetical protein
VPSVADLSPAAHGGGDVGAVWAGVGRGLVIGVGEGVEPVGCTRGVGVGVGAGDGVGAGVGLGIGPAVVVGTGVLAPGEVPAVGAGEVSRRGLGRIDGAGEIPGTWGPG